MRSAEVFNGKYFAGTISENEDGYNFQYDEKYLQREGSKPISLILPLQKEPFESKVLFPFFDGLIPEGWLLDIAVDNWKINSRDRFGLLLTLCKDCIGRVSVLPKEN